LSIWLLLGVEVGEILLAVVVVLVDYLRMQLMTML